jgi:hypothetical protein
MAPAIRARRPLRSPGEDPLGGTAGSTYLRLDRRTAAALRSGKPPRLTIEAVPVAPSYGGDAIRQRVALRR